MDDKKFDKKSANDWITAIESKKPSQRDKDFYPRINQWLNEFQITKVLDLGSGQGVCAEKLNLTKREYIGVEPSPHLINRAKTLYPKFKDKFINGGAYNLPFNNESFDGIFSIAVWHLLKNLDHANAELSRVLKKNGRFLIITANPENYKEWTSSYDKVERNGDRIIGMNLKDNNLEISDSIYLHPIKRMRESLNKRKLKITNLETIRIWTLIEGFREE